MSNKKQRLKNKMTFTSLNRVVRKIKNSKHICENCKQPGGHWVVTKYNSLEALITGIDDQEGYYTCSEIIDHVKS